MKHYFNIAVAALLAIGMAACSSNDSPAEPEQKPDDNIIRLETSIDGISRVSAPDAQGVQRFEQGDEINLLMYKEGSKEPVTTNCKATFDGTSWKYNIDPLTWTDDASRHYIYGIYPSVQFTPEPLNHKYPNQGFAGDAHEGYVADIEMDYTKKENPDDTERLNDYLIAYNPGGNVKSDGTVTLKFTHAMARLCVHVKVGENATITSKDIQGVIIHRTDESGFIDFKPTGSIEYHTNHKENHVRLRNSVQPKEGYDAAYRGLLFPQPIKYILVGAGGKTFYYISPQSITLQPGKHTDIYLELRSDHLQLLDVIITNWYEKVNTDVDNDDVTITDSDKQQ